jgi:hypothetical protein
MVWQDFAAGELAVNAPITQELLQKMHDRDRSLCEGAALVLWPGAGPANISTDAAFGKVFVPRSAAFCYVECTSGRQGSPVVGTPRARIYITDGTTFSYGDYYLNLGVYPQRIAFPVIAVPAALRNKVVTCYLDGEDGPGSTLTFLIINDPNDGTAGAFVGSGVRFAG